MQVLNFIQAIASALNAAPNTTISDVVTVVTSVTNFLETLHKQQQASKQVSISAPVVTTPIVQTVSTTQAIPSSVLPNTEPIAVAAN